MARITTLDELILLRTEGDWSRLRLAIHVPKVIYSARVNGIPASNDMVNEIDFDDGSGTLADIHDSMIMYVGTSAGARDLGEVRIRKAPTSDVFYFGETSRIVWQDNAYLTVMDHFPIREKVVRVSGGGTLMDSDVAFTDQHIDFDPAPVLGPHVVAELVGADVDVTLGPPADTPSWVFDSTIDGVTWVIPDAIAIDDDTAINPVVTFDSPGWHACYCTVAADNGKSFEGIRWVYIWDMENQPTRAFKITEDPNASYDDGGWNFSVDLYDEAHLGEVRDGALVILFAEEWYGSTKQSLGPIVGRENIICMGWIEGSELIGWDPESSGQVTFKVKGPHYWMKQIVKWAFEMFMATNTPDAWNIMPELTVARALWHLLHWRSNITKLIDVSLPDDMRMASRLKSTSGSLWGQLKDVAWSKIFAQPGCDRYGRLWVQIDPQMVPEGDRDFPVVQVITKKDWENKIDFERREDPKMCILFHSGELVDSGGGSVILYSIGPGHSPYEYGDPDIQDGYLVSDQDQANEQTGLYLGWKNNPYPDMPIDMPQNNRMIDLWPRQFLEIMIAEEDTVRGNAFEGNLIPRSMTLRIDGEAGTISTSLGCEGETFTAPSVIGDPPPDSGIDNFDMSIPPLGELDFPESIFSYPSPAEENENHPKKVVMVYYPFGVLYSENFDADTADVVWKTMNAGLDADDKTQIRDLIITPSGSLWIVTWVLAGAADARMPARRIYWAAGLGAKWNLYYDAADHDEQYVVALAKNPTASEQIAFVTTDMSGAIEPFWARFHLGNRSGYTETSHVDIYIAPLWSGLVLRNGIWHLVGSWNHGGSLGDPADWKYSLSGTLIPWNYDFYGDGSVFTIFKPFSGISNATGVSAICRIGKIYAWQGSNTSAGTVDGPFVVYENGDPDDITVGSENIRSGRCAFALSPTGNNGMASSGAPSTKTTDDGGASWLSAGAVPAGKDVFADCGDDNRFIIGGGTTIDLTIDHGSTLVSKIGNLGYAAPLGQVQIIRFIA